ncbi:inositol monophosphatase family protein [Bradyrhizobium canariense]|uniref:inositol monophosphatase family protein n=1 Tax=Bradyrhizobium canariense TaxID=255045 RepID=UPI00137473D7|nr:inositol monophosphatase family protein [Bradyrhizobium canariense]
MTIDTRFQNALNILEAGAGMARSWFDDAHFRVERKDDGTPVTEADRSVERHLRDELSRHFPEDGLLGEEFAEVEGTSGGRWIMDPIDGTKSFIHGVPLYSTLLAYESAQGLEFGAIALPSLGRLIYAQSGRGCFDGQGRQLTTSDRREVHDAYVLSTWLEDWPLELINRLQDQDGVIRTWGDGFGYALVAAGQADAMLDFTVSPFDVAPMPVIMREAGGVFTDFDGVESIHSGVGVAAATPELRDAVLREIAQTTSSPTSTLVE